MRGPDRSSVSLGLFLAWIIAVTDYPFSPLAECADKVFYTPTGIASHMDSFVAPLSLLTGLIRAMANRIPEQALDTLEELEEVWSGLGIYLESDRS
ncbi:MurR/RpiR family transcriptional regulator [Effusibacillus pohliae]|uniref:MurR/RpiR family transcriptional regulator n=1 Tax=Effusibacillus pohliae TaxID=232270 RepID=UPI00037E2B4F|nr:hypothetical protein [Effusibacillus pohliae]